MIFTVAILLLHRRRVLYVASFFMVRWYGASV